MASLKQGLGYLEWVFAQIRHMGNVRAPWGIKISGRRAHVEGILMKGLITEVIEHDTRLIVGPSWVSDGGILPYQVGSP